MTVDSKNWGRAMAAKDYIQLPNDDKWLLEGLIPAEGLVNFYGKPKAGKSFAAMGVALAVANPLTIEWNEFPVRLHGRVLYIQKDTPRPEWISRWERVERAGYELDNINIVDMKIGPYPFDVADPKHFNWLEQQFDATQPILTVFDTLREVHNKNENDSTDMKNVINAVNKLALPHKSAVIFVSHSRKDSAFNAMGADSDIMDEGRGSSYTSGRMDTVVRFTGKSAGDKKPLKGHMQFRGRSVAGEKLPIIQDPDSLLIHLSAAHVKREQLVMQVVREHPEWSDLKKAEWVAPQAKTSVRTAQRDIAALRETTKAK